MEGAWQPAAIDARIFKPTFLAAPARTCSRTGYKYIPSCRSNTYGHASLTPPGESISAESHDWTGISSSTTKRDIARTGSSQSQPDYAPLDVYGSSRHLDSHLGLDLPAFASRPAHYRPLLDESTTRRPLSALASLPSYHSAYSTDTLMLPTPSEPDDSAASWTLAQLPPATRGAGALRCGSGSRCSRSHARYDRARVCDSVASVRHNRQSRNERNHDEKSAGRPSSRPSCGTGWFTCTRT